MTGFPPIGPARRRGRRPGRRRSAGSLLAAAALCGSVGCAGLPALGDPPADGDRFADAGGESGVRPASAQSPADDSPFYEDDERAGLGAGARGRLKKTRKWMNSLLGERGEAEVAYAAVPEEARRRFAAAAAAAERGEHAVAAAEFKRLARKYADTELEEDSLFSHAESLYAAEDYARSQDAFDTLLERYPGTRHIETVSERQFETARRWLGFPEVVRKSDVRPVSYAAADLTPAPKPAKQEPERPFDLSYSVPLIPNLTDHTRPLFDTKGRAMQALKNVWLNDPTGQYADDALMLSASHHLRRGDNMEADRLYEILRKEYPDSPYLEDAYVLGSHAKAVVWQGPVYDDAALEESRASEGEHAAAVPRQRGAGQDPRGARPHGRRRRAPRLGDGEILPAAAETEGRRDRLPAGDDRPPGQQILPAGPRHLRRAAGVGQAEPPPAGECRRPADPPAGTERGGPMTGRRAFLLAPAAAFLTGCGYQFGHLSDPAIRSVAVPTFGSVAERRGVELQLTEAVVKQIQTRTPFRIAHESNADTVLRGRVVGLRKRGLSRTVTGDPREAEFAPAVEVTWEDRRGRVLGTRSVPISADVVPVLSTGTQAVELGQTRATAIQEAVDRLARQVVDLMELPW